MYIKNDKILIIINKLKRKPFFILKNKNNILQK